MYIYIYICIYVYIYVYIYIYMNRERERERERDLGPLPDARAGPAAGPGRLLRPGAGLHDIIDHTVM